MSGSRPLLIRADRAITLDDAPDRALIDDAALLVEGDTITAIGPAPAIVPQAQDATPIDLSGHTVLPGLINAHCHLDYTCLQGKLPAEGPFSKWALGIIAAKRRLHPADYEASVRHGLDQLLQTGTTTVFEISSSYAVTRVAAESPLRIAFFGEVLGLNPWTAGARIRRFRREPADAGASTIIARGMAPHAVHSISKRLMKRIARELAQRPMPVTIHMLESDNEPRINPWFNGQDAVGILNKYGLLDGPVLAVHVNYPDEEDIAVLSARGASVVHCPGSHRFFGYDPFPAEALREAGVPICLGTDSLASNERLDMFREVRLFLQAHPDFSAEEALRMATVVPARFLGYGDRLGLLKAGALADIVAVPTPPGALLPCDAGGACATILSHEVEVSWVMVGGQTVCTPKQR